MRYKTKTSVIKEIIRKIVKESYDHDFDFEAAYNAAPPQVKKLLDEFGDEQDYSKHKELERKLDLLGYDYDFDLSGTATYLAKKKK